MTGFDDGALVLGVTLVGGALISGLVRRSFLSLTAGFVLLGFVLGRGGLDLIGFDPTSGFVGGIATLALVVILFRDGLEVEAEMLRHEWHLPARKLVVGMPVTAGIVALAAHVVAGLTWTESLLLGALLSPTDPVLSSNVVTNPRVPRTVRHSLNLESGLNDGLALPPVLVLLAALGAETELTLLTAIEDVGLGLVYGAVAGYVASRIMPTGRGTLEHESIPPHQKALYALGTAFATYGLTVPPPHANGFIAVFVCAIVLGIRRPDLRHHFESQTLDLVEIAKLGVFVVFGSLLTFGGLFDAGWAAVAIVVVTLLVARPVAIVVALAGTGVSPLLKGFMAWFGPKGVATMAFSLVVLGADIPAGAKIFNLAALVVFCSIIAHGLSDTPAVGWLTRRLERAGPAPPAAVAAPEVQA